MVSLCGLSPPLVRRRTTVVVLPFAHGDGRAMDRPPICSKSTRVLRYDPHSVMVTHIVVVGGAPLYVYVVIR